MISIKNLLPRAPSCSLTLLCKDIKATSIKSMRNSKVCQGPQQATTENLHPCRGKLRTKIDVGGIR